MQASPSLGQEGFLKEAVGVQEGRHGLCKPGQVQRTTRR